MLTTPMLKSRRASRSRNQPIFAVISILVRPTPLYEDGMLGISRASVPQSALSSLQFEACPSRFWLSFYGYEGHCSTPTDDVVEGAGSVLVSKNTGSSSGMVSLVKGPPSGCCSGFCGRSAGGGADERIKFMDADGGSVVGSGIMILGSATKSSGPEPSVGGMDSVNAQGVNTPSSTGAMTRIFGTQRLHSNR
jgi:hypothetical protein